LSTSHRVSQRQVGKQNHITITIASEKKK